jgi:GTP cyclohydrolase I
MIKKQELPPPPSLHQMTKGVGDLLSFVGEDPSREGLRDTPRRFLEAMQFWTSG